MSLPYAGAALSMALFVHRRIPSVGRSAREPDNGIQSLTHDGVSGGAGVDKGEEKKKKGRKREELKKKKI
jgi:hypothetical protein